MENRDPQTVILLVLVLYGPRFSKSYLPWSGSVHRYPLDRPLENSTFLWTTQFHPGHTVVHFHALASKVYPVVPFFVKEVLVRVGPKFLKIFWSWSESVLDFSKFLVLVRS